MAARQGKGDGGLFQRHDHPSCPPLLTIGIDENGKPIKERAEHRCRGRWVAQVDYGFVNGKRQRKTVYGRTRAEAQVARAKALNEKQSGVVATKRPTVETWLRYWLDVICPNRVVKGERGLKVNTMKSHRQKVEGYLIPYIGHHRLDKLQPDHIRAMWDDMRAKGLSEATLRQTHAILHRALAVAVRERKIAWNAAELVDAPATTRNKRVGLTVEQANKVLKADDLRLWCALYLGLRQGEALGLMWDDVDLEDGHIWIRRALVHDKDRGYFFDRPKSEASFRDYPLPPKALAQFKLAKAIRDQVGDTSELVFHNAEGGPVAHRADWQYWADALKAAGVPHVALHAARNTTASLLEAARVPDRIVAQILGQSTIEVTHSYQHAEAAVLRDAWRALDDYMALSGSAPTTSPRDGESTA